MHDAWRGAGYQVATNGGNACFTPDQYSTAFSGPFGGSPVAWQTLRLHDYNGRFTSSFGRHNVVAEAFANSYYQLYDRNYAGFTNRYQTFGERVSDDIVTDRNTFGFGFLGDAPALPERNVRARRRREQAGHRLDRHQRVPARRLHRQHGLQVFANANLKHSSVSQQTNSIRASRSCSGPNSYDVWRISARPRQRGADGAAQGGRIRTSPPSPARSTPTAAR